MDTGRQIAVSALALVFAAAVGCNKPSSSSNSSTSAGEGKSGDIAGSYKILSATNPGGKGGYTGTVSIQKRGDMFSVDWNVANTPPYKGIAVEEGNVLGVGWGLGTAYGVAVYKVSGGNLDGKWATSASQQHAGTEKLSGAPGLNGTYKITKGKVGDTGKEYTGSVTIAPAGSVYNVTWTLPDSSYSGVGILEGDVFTVGWGTAGAGAGVVMYKVGDKLDGKWAQPRGTALGTEVLARN